MSTNLNLHLLSDYSALNLNMKFTHNVIALLE